MPDEVTRPGAPDVAVSSGDIGPAMTAFADHVLYGTGDVPNIALGLLVWGIDRGHDRRHWYFVVCSIDAKGELRIDQFKIARDDRDLAEQTVLD